MSSCSTSDPATQVVELARSGTRVSQLAETFDITQASIYSWLKAFRDLRRRELDLPLGAEFRRLTKVDTVDTVVLMDGAHDLVVLQRTRLPLTGRPGG
jgi:transposase-like protein